MLVSQAYVEERELCRSAMKAAVEASKMSRGEGSPNGPQVIVAIADAIDGLGNLVDTDWRAATWISAFIRNVDLQPPTTVDALKTTVCHIARTVRKADRSDLLQDVTWVCMALHEVLLGDLERQDEVRPRLRPTRRAYGLAGRVYA